MMAKYELRKAVFLIHVLFFLSFILNFKGFHHPLSLVLGEDDLCGNVTGENILPSGEL